MKIFSRLIKWLCEPIGGKKTREQYYWISADEDSITIDTYSRNVAEKFGLVRKKEE